MATSMRRDDRPDSSQLHEIKAIRVLRVSARKPGGKRVLTLAGISFPVNGTPPSGDGVAAGKTKSLLLQLTGVGLRRARDRLLGVRRAKLLPLLPSRHITGNPTGTRPGGLVVLPQGQPQANKWSKQNDQKRSQKQNKKQQNDYDCWHRTFLGSKLRPRLRKAAGRLNSGLSSCLTTPCTHKSSGPFVLVGDS
jgi:hypothetical protein